jgi:hypothetical protein
MVKQDKPEEEEENRPNMPDLPSSPTTTADLGMTMFDMAHDSEMRPYANLLTKGDLDAMQRPIFVTGLATGIGLMKMGFKKSGKRIADYTALMLMARVSEKGKRMKQFESPFQLELHHEKRKDEEKPKI